MAQDALIAPTVNGRGPPSPPVSVRETYMTSVRPPSRTLRHAVRVAIAAVLLSGLFVAWHMPDDVRRMAEAVMAPIPPSRDAEFARLRGALETSETARRNLQAELDRSRANEERGSGNVKLWSEDSQTLMYRAPPRPR